MRYSQIREILGRLDNASLYKADVAVSMMMSAPSDISDEKFDIMCKYAEEVIRKLATYNTTDVTDTIVEAQQENNTVFHDGYVLTDEDLIKMNRLPEILDACCYRF